MTEREFIEEVVWDKVQTGEYVEVDGRIYNYLTGEFIGMMDDIQIKDLI